MYFLVVYVCNLQNIHSLSNVVILFTIKTCQPCHYNIKPVSHVYTREPKDNKKHAFLGHLWATLEFSLAYSSDISKSFSWTLSSFPTKFCLVQLAL